MGSERRRGGGRRRHRPVGKRGREKRVRERRIRARAAKASRAPIPGVEQRRVPRNPGRGIQPPAPERAAAFLRARPRWQWIALVVVAVLGAALAFTWRRCLFQGCPDVGSLVAYQPGGAPVLLDRHGQRFADVPPTEGQLVRLGTLPPYVADAFVAVEDQRFRDHGGVDWPRTLGAALANVRAGEVDEGASTITMQLARNLFPRELPGQHRTWQRKLLEVRVAREMEEVYSKDEILELYLNHILFGEGARGIEAAARQFFGQSASRLTLPQAALLAALPKGPSAYNPRRHPQRARARRDLVLALMRGQSRISPAQADEARGSPLGVIPRTSSNADGFAPYFVDEVRRELEDHFGPELYDQPLQVTTTLDRTAQAAAETELERQLQAIENGELGRFEGPRHDPAAPAGAAETSYLQGAVVALDARDGDVLAWVGGRDFRQSRFDRVSTAQRQAGSAFKPFVYAAALMARHTLADVISGQPLKVPLDRRTSWEPRNFSGTFQDHLSMREALVQSNNVAAVRVALDVGTVAVALLAEKLGIEPPIDQQPSMALGTVAVSPLELAAAYGTFATLGHRARPRFVLQVKDAAGQVLWKPDATSEPLLDPDVAYLVTSALQDVVTRGSAVSVREAGFEGPAAGKTGTTNDGADTWFVGYTPQVVAAVWIGFDKPRSIVPRATGGRLAAPVWARMMPAILGDGERPGWVVPAGVVSAPVDAATGRVLEAGCPASPAGAYREVFLRGGLPVGICPAAEAAAAEAARVLAGDPEEQLDPGLAPLPGAPLRPDEPDALAPATRSSPGGVPSYGNQPPMPGLALRSPAPRPLPSRAPPSPAP